MSHQDGLAGLTEPMEPPLWFDWPAITGRLAAMAPLWPPGTASGYHPITYGFTAGEIFRRVDGRTMGRALREDLAVPFDLDLWIGLPESEFDRVAELKRPDRFADFGPITDVKRLAFLTPWAGAGRQGPRRLPPRRNPLRQRPHHRAGSRAPDERHGLQRRARRRTHPSARNEVAQATRERIAGRDLVLPFDLSWGAGFLRNVPNLFYGPSTAAFGHSGWGGSCAFADPERGLSGAYVMNRQSEALLGDPRAVALIDTAYACL